MDNKIISKIKTIKNRYKKLEILFLNNSFKKLNYKNYSELYKEYYKLSKIVKYYNIWSEIINNIKSTKLLLEDKEIKEIANDEIKKLKIQKKNIENKIYDILLLKNNHDKYGCLLEIRSGTGGNEASLFAQNLFKMYSKFIENLNWNIEIININYSDNGGYKEIIIRIPNLGSYGKLKFESGGHRVQRVPDTESQGRIHTSTCTIAVIPNIPNEELPKIESHDIRIDTFRSSGAGGQHVNTTDSAIRITHLKTGLVVECQDERSQHKNKAKALSVLGSRLRNMEKQRRHQKKVLKRKNLIGSGERSDRIRTYNFSQGRVTDHRIGFTSYKIQEIMNGNLDILIKPVITEYESNKLNVFSKKK
ncbi:MAG: peptide chain release factor 1 [Enterobacterales bacterium]